MWALAIACVLLVVFSTFLTLLLAQTKKQQRFLGDKRRTLFITAHPDDECMFFAPTILSLTARQPETVHLLCLSDGLREIRTISVSRNLNEFFFLCTFLAHNTGGFYGHGAVRRKELAAATTMLGIPADNVQLVNDRWAQQLNEHTAKKVLPYKGGKYPGLLTFSLSHNL